MKTLPKWLMSLLLLVGFCGLLPHLLWAREAPQGQELFKCAFDEDYYYWSALWSLPRPDRVISAFLVRALFGIGGNRWLPVLMDVVWPMLATAAAWRLCRRLWPSAQAGQMMMATLLLVFSDVLSANCVVAFPPWWTWSALGSALPDWAGQCFSRGTITFFEIFRSPDPQISYVFVFVWLERLLAYYLEATRARFFWVVFLTMVVSSFLVFPACLCLIFLGLLTLLGHRRELGLAGLAGALTLVLQTSYSFATHSVIWNQVFKSHLPALSPGLLWGGLVLLWLQRQKQWDNPQVRWTACCALVAIVALNQQVLTGHMISTRNWEWYGNFVFVALALISCASLKTRPQGADLCRPGLVLLLACLFLPVAQTANWRIWRKHNARAALYAQLLAAHKSRIERSPVVVEDFEITPQFVWRAQDDWNFLLDYRRNLELDLHPGDGQEAYRRQIHRDVFLQMSCLRVSAEQFSKLLDEELQTGDGHWWECLFHFRYNHRFFFDQRRDDRGLLRAEQSSVVASYGNFLRQAVPLKRRIFVLSHSPLSEKSDPFPQLEKLDSAKWQDQEVFLYQSFQTKAVGGDRWSSRQIGVTTTAAQLP